MPEQYNFIYQGGTAEISEKKSRFLAEVFPVHSEEEALLSIDKCKKKYRDASHHCYAFSIGKKNEMTRCSDDKEPSNTAGKPILDVLLGESLHDAAIIVTRYFGGTLLGTGGLVRAYQNAAKAGIAASVIAQKVPAKRLNVNIPYTDLGKLQYLAAQLKIYTLNTNYMDNVSINLVVSMDTLPLFLKEWQSLSNGKTGLTELDCCFYSLVGGKIILYDFL